jgi:hypothetical protein
MGEVRIRNSEPADRGKRSAGRRLAEALLGPVFRLLLLIPLVRLSRRRAWWKWVRGVGFVAGVGLLIAGRAHPAVWASGVVLAALAMVLGPLEDPDRMQKLAETLGARHVINGGTLARGNLRLAVGSPLLLLVTPEEVLVVAETKPDQVRARFRLVEIEAILVEGQGYRPHYVSFAKAPPTRDERADRGATCRLEVRFAGEPLEVEYRGVFALHLAEVAAHTLYECKRVLARSPAAALSVIG